METSETQTKLLFLVNGYKQEINLTGKEADLYKKSKKQEFLNVITSNMWLPVGVMDMVGVLVSRLTENAYVLAV